MPRQSFVRKSSGTRRECIRSTAFLPSSPCSETLEEVRQNELRRVTSRLSHLTTEELQAVEQMTRSLVHKLQHAPIQAIKRAAQEGDRETLATIQSVFDLERRAKFG